MSATEVDSSKSKSPMSATHESMSSKGGSTDGFVEEDVDDIAFDADTDDVIEYLFGNDPRQELSDDFYDCGRPAMTVEERSACAKQIRDSDEGRKLKLMRMIKWNQKLACPVNYYITFEAEDVDTGEVEAYQTKVERLIPQEESEVPIFRVKPRPASPTDGSS